MNDPAQIIICRKPCTCGLKYKMPACIKDNTKEFREINLYKGTVQSCRPRKTYKLDEHILTQLFLFQTFGL